MRGEQSRLQSTNHGQEEEEEEEDKEQGRTPCIRNGKPGRHTDITEAPNAQRTSLTPAVKMSVMNQQLSDRPTCSSCQCKNFLCSVNHHLPPVDCRAVNGTCSHHSSLLQTEPRLSPSPAPQPSPQSRLNSSVDSFNSSFSFIQQSLNSSQRTETTAATVSQEPEPLNQSTKVPSTPHRKPATLSLEQSVSKQSTLVQPLPSSVLGSQAEREELSLGGRFWRECLWGGREGTSDLPDCDSRSLDLTSSLSVDSDTASASSVTSGYESATPASEQGWDNLVKKYEGVLQDCLQNNRTHTKVGMIDLRYEYDLQG